MDITVVGRGRLGTALAQRWVDAGHDVGFAVREVAGDSPVGGARLGLLGEAERDADVVVLAVPGDVVVEVAAGLRVRPDAVVVDATNPVGEDLTHAPPGGRPSAAAAVATALAPGVRVVKAFNQVGAPVVADPRFPAGPPTALVAGDDRAAKDVVLGLAADAGLDPVDAGGLSRAAHLEHLALLWVALAYGGGRGDAIAWRLQARPDPLEAAIRGMYDAWNEGRMDDAYAMLDPAVVDRSAGEGESGLAGVRRALDTVRSAFPDSVYEVLEVVSNGVDHTAARLRFTGTHLGDLFGDAPTGRRASWTETRICRWRGGRIVEHVANIDSYGMRRQLGLLPQAGRAGW